MVRLSILCMSFNRPVGLRRAMQSVVGQTYQDWELIVCDDQSPDMHVPATFFRVAEENPDRQIRWLTPLEPLYERDYRHRCNTLGLKLNQGLDSIAHTVEYVTYIGDGVTYEPDRCARMIAYMDAHPEVGVVWGHQVTETWEDGSCVRQSEHQCGGAPQDWPGQRLAAQLEHGNCVDHCSVVERVDVSRAYPWTEDPQHWRSPDLERWRRMADDGLRFAMVPEIGERKRTGQRNLGTLLQAGADIAEIASQRTD